MIVRDKSYAVERVVMGTGGNDVIYANGVVQVPGLTWLSSYDDERFYVSMNSEQAARFSDLDDIGRDVYFGAILEPFALNKNGDYALDSRGDPTPAWANYYAVGIGNPAVGGSTKWDGLNNGGPGTMTAFSVGTIDEAHVGLLHRYKGNPLGIDDVTFHGPGQMMVSGLTDDHAARIWIDYGGWNGKANAPSADIMRFNGELGWEVTDVEGFRFMEGGKKFAMVESATIHADSFKKAIDPDGAGDHFGQEFKLIFTEAHDDFGVDRPGLKIEYTGNSYLDDFDRIAHRHANTKESDDYWEYKDQMFDAGTPLSSGADSMEFL